MQTAPVWTIAAAGGTWVRPNGDGSLANGLVERSCHRRGLGTRLLIFRLARLAENPEVSRIVLSTSQHSCAFFARFGFRVTSTSPDGYAPGLDCVAMALDLDADIRARLLRQAVADSEAALETDRGA